MIYRYDREEGSTFDADSSSIFLGDEASFQKKEAELAKKLVRGLRVIYFLIVLEFTKS